MSEGVFERCTKFQAYLSALTNVRVDLPDQKTARKGTSAAVVPLIDFAVSMDERSFARYQQDIRSAVLRFDCTRTRRELEEGGGIIVPDLTMICWRHVWRVCARATLR